MFWSLLATRGASNASTQSSGRYARVLPRTECLNSHHEDDLSEPRRGTCLVFPFLFYVLDLSEMEGSKTRADEEFTVLVLACILLKATTNSVSGWEKNRSLTRSNFRESLRLRKGKRLMY